MTVTLNTPRLAGEVKAIASKSEVHRLLICAAMADTETLIECSEINADIDATARCLNALGADIKYQDGLFTVNPISQLPCGEVTLMPGESGSTLRFLLPVVCGLGINARFIMEGRLGQRPLSPLKELLEENGATIRQEENILYVSGKVAANNYTIAGNISSQFISGLLFMLPRIGGNITITGKIESQPYIGMTVNALTDFGCKVIKTQDGYSVPRVSPLTSPIRTKAKGDWSNAAFFITAGVIGKQSITITDIDIQSSQGDKAIIEVLKKFGAEIHVHDNKIIACPSKLSGTQIDASQIPDLVPILSIAASVAKGTTHIYGAGRLRIKESDRLKACCDMLTNLGAKCHETGDGLVIEGLGIEGLGPEAQLGQTLHTDTIIDSYNDHRIAMSAAIAATVCNCPVTINGAEAVNKSYPLFWEDYQKLSVKEDK
ncbi:MAG: 3-phosphoshikimate 1-carboxyvinyltransferase [Ruminococcaceae bacterium]|nr:3-phosphoshikimate 1-carboxyvinyltransferase [Oscillospiraceae bacterium]